MENKLWDTVGSLLLCKTWRSQGYVLDATSLGAEALETMFSVFSCKDSIPQACGEGAVLKVQEYNENQ